MNKRTLLLILFSAIALVCFKYSLRNPIHHLPVKKEQIDVVSFPDSVTQSQNLLAQKINHLFQYNDSLKNQLLQSNVGLKQATFKLKQLQINLQKLILNDTSKNIVQRISNCDSMKIQIDILNIHGKVKDSLAAIVQCEWQQISNNKDTVIQTQQKQYGELKHSFIQHIEQLNYLKKDNQFLYKAAKRKAISNRILSASLLIATGIATAYFIQSQI